ncbi:MAG: hypothetical protein FWC34_07400 [Bacteroidetes bacterium]|nr:hypothetical protein [Bacteroidota bacterium]
MDIEQILFIAIAVALSAFSMYKKAKKQKESSRERAEEVYHDFPEVEDPYKTPNPVVTFDPYDAANLPQYSNIPTKKSKKKQKAQNFETINFQAENPKNASQTTDFENNIGLLEDFEGTEIQKAFLFSEIFKNTKN